MSPSSYFTPEQKERIVAAIREAEAHTSAEIRVHIENHCRKEALDRAVDVFALLRMHKTAAHNGVLVYVALKDHKVAIIGDSAINRDVPPGLWDECYALMAKRFRKGEICEGICEAILTFGQRLNQPFPHRPDDVNELPDDISFGK